LWQNSAAFATLPLLEIKDFHLRPSSCNRNGMLDPIANRTEHYMDLLSTRQKLVASNIANIDTPGYKTKDIDFQFEYMSLVQGGAPNVREVQGLITKNDGNNVSLDRESRLLAENALRFNMAANLIHSQIQMVQTAIQESK
jgi:flagellar basal-body rod protein FlgB